MTRLPWLGLYLLGCLAEFFGVWAKDAATNALRGGDEEDDDGEDDEPR